MLTLGWQSNAKMSFHLHLVDRPFRPLQWCVVKISCYNCSISFKSCFFFSKYSKCLEALPSHEFQVCLFLNELPQVGYSSTLPLIFCSLVNQSEKNTWSDCKAGVKSGWTENFSINITSWITFCLNCHCRDSSPCSHINNNCFLVICMLEGDNELKPLWSFTLNDGKIILHSKSFVFAAFKCHKSSLNVRLNVLLPSF